MPAWIWILLGAAALALLGVFIVACLVVRYLLHQPRDTREDAEAKEIERGNLAPGELDALALQEFTAKSFDGFALRCAWLRCGRETKRVAVHSCGKPCDVPLCRVFLPGCFPPAGD